MPPTTSAAAGEAMVAGTVEKPPVAAGLQVAPGVVRSSGPASGCFDGDDGDDGDDGAADSAAGSAVAAAAGAASSGAAASAAPAVPAASSAVRRSTGIRSVMPATLARRLTPW